MADVDSLLKNIIFFTHGECPYYPCHAGSSELNCLFCFCPLYHLGNCPGTPQWLDNGTKDCSACLFPHSSGNFFQLMLLVKRKV